MKKISIFTAFLFLGILASGQTVSKLADTTIKVTNTPVLDTLSLNYVKAKVAEKQAQINSYQAEKKMLDDLITKATAERDKWKVIRDAAILAGVKDRKN